MGAMFSGVSNAHTARWVSPGQRSPLNAIGEPQRPQKLRITPDEEEYSRKPSPLISTWASRNPAQVSDGAEDARRQLSQWQLEMKRGSPRAVNFTAPQRQCPVRVEASVMGLFRDVFGTLQ